MKKILFYFIFFFFIIKKNIILSKNLKKETFKSKILNYYNRTKKSIYNFYKDPYSKVFASAALFISTPIMIINYFNNRYLKYMEMLPDEEIKLIIDPGNLLFSQQIKIGCNLTKLFNLKNKNEITHDHCKKIFLQLKNYISKLENSSSNNLFHKDLKINPYLVDIRIKNESNLLILIVNLPIINNNKKIIREKIHIKNNNYYNNNTFHNIDKEYYEIEYPTLNDYFSKVYTPSYLDTYYDILYDESSKDYLYKYYSDFSWKIMHPWLS